MNPSHAFNPVDLGNRIRLMRLMDVGKQRDAEPLLDPFQNPQSFVEAGSPE